MKARQNIGKHGITFREACEAFFDPFLILIDASRNNEPREAVIGYDKSGRLLFVVHVEILNIKDKENYRIISAKRATREHRRIYENI